MSVLFITQNGKTKKNISNTYEKAETIPKIYQINIHLHQIIIL